MLRFNLRFILRNMKRHKFYTLLDVSGLTLALLSCIFISLYVLDELSYDRHWNNSERIFRLYTDSHVGQLDITHAWTPAPLAKVLKDEFPEVEATGRWVNSGPITFKLDDQLFKQKKIIYADQEITSILEFQAIHGDLGTALSEPNTLILTKTTAEKYFGKVNPVGRSLESNDGILFNVTCVIEDIPSNTHFEAEMIRTTINDRWSDPTKFSQFQYWIRSFYHTFIKLKPGTNPLELQEKFEGMYETHFEEVTKGFNGQSYKEFRQSW